MGIFAHRVANIAYLERYPPWTDHQAVLPRTRYTFNFQYTVGEKFKYFQAASHLVKATIGIYLGTLVIRCPLSNALRHSEILLHRCCYLIISPSDVDHIWSTNSLVTTPIFGELVECAFVPRPAIPI